MLVIKVGTNVLADDHGIIDRDAVSALSQQIIDLKKSASSDHPNPARVPWVLADKFFPRYQNRCRG